MIDTIKFSLPITNPEQFLERLDTFIAHHKKDSGAAWYSGRLKNLRIVIRQNTITVEGSLPNYLFDQNLPMLDYHSFSFAIKLISDKLGIDVIDARLSRLDIFVNLLLSDKPEIYLDSITNYGKHKKTIYPNKSRLFKNTRESLVIYDKLDEMKIKKQKRKSCVTIKNSNKV